MKRTQSLYSDNIQYELELSDFNEFKDEYNITQDNLGFTLKSKSNPKYSIHIGQIDIKYDHDISEFGHMLAINRIYVNERILRSFSNDPHNFQKYIPKTIDKLIELIDEFKFRGMGKYTTEEVLKFIN